MQRINLFLAAHFVDTDLYEDHIEISTSNITAYTDDIDVSPWCNWSDDVSVITDIYCVDTQSATETGSDHK